MTLGEKITTTMSTFEEMDFREGFAGGCYVNGTKTCVAQPEGICDNETFVSAHYLRANGGHSLRYCAGDLFSVLIGRCMDSGKCSNLKSRCQDERSFVAFDPTCTIIKDLSLSVDQGVGAGAYVTYGKCGDRCVWSSEDCIQGEEEYVVNDPECTAEKVQIGACFAGHAFCAVGPQSCTQPGIPDEPYWTHQQVKEKVGANCFLAKLPASPTPAPKTTIKAPSPPFSSSGNIGSNKYNNDKYDNFASLDENQIPGAGSGGVLSKGALAGIVAVVAVLIGIGIGVGAVYAQRKQNKKETWHVQKQHPPIEDILSSEQVEIADDEILSEL